MRLGRSATLSTPYIHKNTIRILGLIVCVFPVRHASIRAAETLDSMSCTTTRDAY